MGIGFCVNHLYALKYTAFIKSAEPDLLSNVLFVINIRDF
jgi:hypothetical protein